MSTKTDAVIENAADVIREVLHTFQGGRRWVKDSFGPDKGALASGSYCLVGGVRAVLGNGNQSEGQNHPLYRETIQVLAQTIRPSIKKGSSSTLIRFNDSKRTTFDRVEAILAAALVKARKLAGVSA